MNRPTIWLASYPRSGNTYARVLLNDCFGVKVGSKYSEDYSRFSAEFSQMLGRFRPNDFGIVKTHDHPEDDSPAIFIIRDGRASVLSYFHYSRNFETARSIEDVINGDVPFGSWSDHYRAWQPAQRQNTLFLKYEAITSNPDEAVEQLAGFLNRRPSGTFERDFAAMQKAAPLFFRAGSNQANIAELSAEQLALFNARHGEAMAELGYT